MLWYSIDEELRMAEDDGKAICDVILNKTCAFSNFFQIESRRHQIESKRCGKLVNTETMWKI